MILDEKIKSIWKELKKGGRTRMSKFQVASIFTQGIYYAEGNKHELDNLTLTDLEILISKKRTFIESIDKEDSEYKKELEALEIIETHYDIRVKNITKLVLFKNQL